MITMTNYLSIHARELSKKYAGRHIAVVDNKVVAAGKNGLEVYRKATRNIPKNKKVGVFYLPTKNEILTAL